MLLCKIFQRSGADLLTEAPFFELKTLEPELARAQALRRARAYFQVLRGSQAPPDDRLGSLQLWLYRHLPVHAPWLTPLGVAIALGLVDERVGALAGMLAAIGVCVFLCSTSGRQLLRLLDIMFRARRAERRGETSEQWEMARP